MTHYSVSQSILSIFLMFFSLTILGQDFSGKITYSFEYRPKDSSTKVKDLVVDMPTDSVVYTIKNGHYQSQRYFEGKCIEFYTYNNSTKKMYYTTEDRDYFIYFFPHDQRYSSPIFTEKQKYEKQILDYTTSLVTTIVDGMEMLNFYSPEIRVEPSSFEGHAFGGWYELLKRNNGAIPLKTATNYYDHYEVKTATKIEFIDLDNSFFEVPEGNEIVASRESLDELAHAEDPTPETYYCYMSKIEEIADKMIEGKNYNYVLRMVIDTDGSVSHIKAINSDYLGFDKVAEKIVEECNLEFNPGKINDLPQKAEIFFPLGL